jgi:hypothetical protein
MNSANKYEVSRAQVIQMCREWLTQKHFKNEWAYQYIKPKILVEELLVSKDNKELKDYRMYTFHGVVKAISVGSATFRRYNKNVFFDRNWKEFKLTTYKETRQDSLPEIPAGLEEMIDVAQKLGEGIDFARIDLYDTEQGVVLGEMTMYPEGGMRDSPASCPIFNKWLGDCWKLGEIDVLFAFYWNIFSLARLYCDKIVTTAEMIKLKKWGLK